MPIQLWCGLNQWDHPHRGYGCWPLLNWRHNIYTDWIFPAWLTDIFQLLLQRIKTGKICIYFYIGKRTGEVFMKLITGFHLRLKTGECSTHVFGQYWTGDRSANTSVKVYLINAIAPVFQCLCHVNGTNIWWGLWPPSLCRVGRYLYGLDIAYVNPSTYYVFKVVKRIFKTYFCIMPHYESIFKDSFIMCKMYRRCIFDHN